MNTLDSLSRTCRQVHFGLLQYRKSLLASTLHCRNETMAVEPGESLRYRARAGNWFYMEDGRNYNGKSGSCARDLVGECRRCNEVICRVSVYVLSINGRGTNRRLYRTAQSNHQHQSLCARDIGGCVKSVRMHQLLLLRNHPSTPNYPCPLKPCSVRCVSAKRKVFGYASHAVGASVEQITNTNGSFLSFPE